MQQNFAEFECEIKELLERRKILWVHLPKIKKVEKKLNHKVNRISKRKINSLDKFSSVNFL